MTKEAMKMTPQRTNDPLDDVARLVRRAQTFATRILRNAKAGDIEITNAADATRLLQSISSLSRSACELEKLKFEKSGAIRAALQVLSDDVRVRLNHRPDLQKQIRAELYASQADVVSDLKQNPRALPQLKASLAAHLADEPVTDSRLDNEEDE